jgi:hypothetical protein
VFLDKMKVCIILEELSESYYFQKKEMTDMMSRVSVLKTSDAQHQKSCMVRVPKLEEQRNGPLYIS